MRLCDFPMVPIRATGHNQKNDGVIHGKKHQRTAAWNYLATFNGANG
jgi:hypothetical protein